MRRPAAALALCLALAGGLTACGGDGESTDVVPRSTPDLVAPENVKLGAATTRDDDASSTTSTTGTTGTTTTQPQATTQEAPAAPTETEQPPQQQQPAPEGTGGAGATTTPPPSDGGDTGTSTGNSGGFSDFCEQNPGACPE